MTTANPRHGRRRKLPEGRRLVKFDIEGAWNDFDGAAAIVVLALVLVVVSHVAQAAIA